MLLEGQNATESPGVFVVPSAVLAATCSTWLARVDAAYREVDATSSPDFVPESSSFRLRAVTGLSAIDIWSALSRPARDHCAVSLGPSLAIDVDQCWVRRQHPPLSAPPRHRPHSWHQDGALGFEFVPGSQRAPGDGLLQMITCWIALTPCGVDRPGLEFVDDRVDRLLSPTQLTDDAVNASWSMSRRTRPALQGGDAIVFGGHVLHRTHVSAAMTGTRTSFELRCFRADAIPSRLADDEFVTVASNG